jgi:photosystem II stability/assembly factor-like uncharacterized protein
MAWRLWRVDNLFHLVMKKLILTFVLLSISTLNIYAQQGWFWQNPLPQGNSLSYVNFWGNSGLIIGSGSTILKTSNNGINWILFNVPAYNFVYQKFVFDLNNYCLATDGNLLKKTTNGGVSWFSNEFISGITPNLFFVNMNTGYSIVNNTYSSSSPLILYKTTNGGINWNLNKTDSSSRINAIFFPDESTGYMAGSRSNSALYTKLLKTTNGGATWDSINTNTRFSANSLFFINGLTGFINIYSGWIYKTTNGAASWDSVANTGSSGGRFYFINSNTGFISGQYNTFKTTNSGVTWTTLSIPSGSFYYNGSDTYTATGDYGSIYRSTNNGSNWVNYRQSVYNSYMNDVQVIDENIAYIGCGNGTILKTVNGGNIWSAMIDSTIEHYNTIFFFNSLTGFGAGQSRFTGSDIKKTTNGGLNWYSVSMPQTEQIFNLDFTNDSIGYAGGKQGTFLKSINKGAVWNITGNFDAFATGGIEFINQNTGFWVGSSYVTNAQIRKTTNGGYNWSETLLDSIEMLYDIEFKNSSTGFACGYYPTATGYFGAICMTTNQGSSWSVQYPQTNMIYELSIADSNTIYASCDGGKILKSTNGGVNWSVFQSCYSGYLLSLDFINQNTGYACSYGGIIIKTTTGGSPIGIEPISNNNPNEFILFQNYPNPFNPVTKINFSIPVNSQLDPVNIYVYDVTGREVINYSYDNLKAGIYSIDFDGTDLASGVYFYQLVTGDLSQTRKMVLIK